MAPQLATSRQPAFAGGRFVNDVLPALSFQESAHHHSIVRIVLDEEDRPCRCRIHHTFHTELAAAVESPPADCSRFGQKKWKVAPLPSSDSTHALPPCTSTSCLTIANPTPVPSSVALKAGFLGCKQRVVD